MGTLSPWHLIIVAVIVLLVFGRSGKLSGIMGDAAKGIRAFKDGLKDDHETPVQPVQTLPRVEPEKDPIVR